MTSFKEYVQKSRGDGQEVNNSKKTENVFIGVGRGYDARNVFNREHDRKDPFNNFQFLSIIGRNAVYTFEHDSQNTKYNDNKEYDIKCFPPKRISTENDNVHFLSPSA